MSIFAVIDFETTGLSPQYGDRAIEIGVAITDGRKILDTYESLMNPGISITPLITDITGITQSMVSSAPASQRVMQEVSKFVGELPLVAHNARFDQKFYNYELKKLNKSFTNLFICTLLVGRRLYPYAENHKLATLANMHKINTSGHHRALADAVMTANLFGRIKQDLEQLYDDKMIDATFFMKYQKANKRDVKCFDMKTSRTNRGENTLRVKADKTEPNYKNQNRYESDIRYQVIPLGDVDQNSLSKSAGVFAIKRINAKKVYIQISSCLQHDIALNIKRLSASVHENNELQRDYDQFGEKLFELNLIKDCENLNDAEDRAKKYEQYRKEGNYGLYHDQFDYLIEAENNDFHSSLDQSVCVASHAEKIDNEATLIEHHCRRCKKTNLLEMSSNFCPECGNSYRKETVKTQRNQNFKNLVQVIPSDVCKQKKLKRTHLTNKDEKSRGENHQLPTNQKAPRHKRLQFIGHDELPPSLGVVVIANAITSKFFVFSSHRLRAAVNRELKLLEDNKHLNANIQKDYNKYGPESFFIDEVLQSHSFNEALEIEKNKINELLNKQEMLYNKHKQISSEDRYLKLPSWRV
jgi:DNA polymerase-3 subunit epsilon